MYIFYIYCWRITLAGAGVEPNTLTTNPMQVTEWQLNKYMVFKRFNSFTIESVTFAVPIFVVFDI